MRLLNRQGRVLLVAAVLAVGAVCWSGCGGDDNPANNNSNNSGNSGNNNGNNNNGGEDGSSKTVQLGGLKWMKKNLNVETADSWCYLNRPDSCAKYGRLYTWAAAKAACQSVGMRLPTRADWDNLAESVGGRKSSDYGMWHNWLDAGKKLKSTSGWYNNGNGTDDFQFSALPGGGRYSDGGFRSAGYGGYWWTATEISDDYAYYRYVFYDRGYVYEDFGDKSDGFSARCVKD